MRDIERCQVGWLHHDQGFSWSGVFDEFPPPCARTIDYNVGNPVLASNTPCKLPYVFTRSGVTRFRHRQLPDSIGDAFEFTTPSGDQDDAETTAGKVASSIGPDTARRTGDQSNLHRAAPYQIE
jgi:hypothetical protein